MHVPDVLKLLIAGLVACGLPAQAADLRVEYVVAREEALQMDIQLTGTIEALDSIALGFRQSGALSRSWPRKAIIFRPESRWRVWIRSSRIRR